MKKLRYSIVVIILCSAFFVFIFPWTSIKENLAPESIPAAAAYTEKEDVDLIAIKEISAEKRLQKNLKIQSKPSVVNVNTPADLNKNLEGLSLENKIKTYVGSKLPKLGLVYYDIKTGNSIVINGSKTFTAASTVKVPMNIVLYDLIAEGKISINESLTYSASSDYEEGTGILQYNRNGVLNKPIPLKTLSDYSIIYSDNIATNMIIRRIGRENMKNRFDAILGHSTKHQGNYITPNDAAAFLKVLYSNPNNNPFYAQLINVMKKTEFHDRIDKYIPQNLTAHKIGNYGAYTNDIGIIYTNNPYILAIYTEGMTNAEETIAQISKLIYNEQNKL